MRNAEIAAALGARDLYELDGAVRYRVLAYREAARAIAREPGLGRAARDEGRLTELPGVGKTLAEKIDALLETGEIPRGGEAEGEVPARPWSR